MPGMRDQEEGRDDRTDWARMKAERRERGAGREGFWFVIRSAAKENKRKAWGAEQFMKPKQRHDAWANDLRSGACEKNEPE